ncbi:MAG: hypothetical protein AB1716_21475 [Planctomycetota bacterium]
MLSKLIPASLQRPLVALAFAGFAALLLLPARGLPRAEADGGEMILMVEEDWKLILNEPGALKNAPQFHTVMSPDLNLNGSYAQVLWNYREYPSYAPGGLQLDGWHGDVKTRTLTVGEEPLSSSAETITWTQRLATSGSQLAFQVLNGNATSWGSFGGENMTMSFWAAVPDLNHYSPLFSKESALITYGSNRVNLLVITEVRKYGASGLISRDTTPIIVFQGVLPGGD